MSMLLNNPLATTLLAAAHKGFFYPVQGSTIARDVDPLAWFIHIMTIVFTVGIIGVTVWYVIKYRASVHPVPQPPGHNNVLEVTWTAIPAIIVFICFFWGFRVFMKMTVYQPAAVQIEAVGSQWNWQFKYKNPNGGPPGVSNELYMPVNTPVEFILSSNDVIHALFIPVTRMKKDVVPGRFNTMLVEATLEGDFDVYCAEYCGDSHSKMTTKAHVLNQDAYDAMILEVCKPVKEGLSDAENGKNLASINGCFSCHSIDGKPGTGPTWLDLYGATGHELADGSTVTVDDQYILDSIRNPNKQVRKGFGPPSAMNPFPATQIPDEYVRYIIAYQKSISKFAPKDDSTKPSGNLPTANPKAGQPETTGKPVNDPQPTTNNPANDRANNPTTAPAH